MKAGRVNRRRVISRRKQRGVVLLIALIILVAMTLAGIGMMRSVDTGSMIAGNLAFRQATLQASDAGTSRAFSALVSLANSANTNDKAILEYNNGQPCPAGVTLALCSGSVNVPGYSTTPLHACEVTHTCLVASEYAWWTDDNSWAGAPTVAVTDPNNPAIPIATVSYLIHRMCEQAGPTNGQLCQTYLARATGGTSKRQLEPEPVRSVFYRITTRSVGVRNTVTYTQTLVLISE